MNYVFESPVKDKTNKKRKRSRSATSDDSDGDYGLPLSRGSSPASSLDLGGSVDEVDLDGSVSKLAPPSSLPGHPKPLQGPEASLIPDARFCRMCQNIHGPSECPLMEDSLNLAGSRELIAYKSPEPYEIRVCRNSYLY